MVCDPFVVGLIFDGAPCRMVVMAPTAHPILGFWRNKLILPPRVVVGGAGPLVFSTVPPAPLQGQRGLWSSGGEGPSYWAARGRRHLL